MGSRRQESGRAFCLAGSWARYAVFAEGIRLTTKVDERISFGIPIIACPDYLKLMEKRASRFSLPIAPPYFPASLIELVRRRDPVMKAFDRVDDANPYLGKKVLVLSGGADKLVPWEASREFVEKLAVGPSGVKKVLVVEGVGHECTPEMLATAGQFVGEEILSD